MRNIRKKRIDWGLGKYYKCSKCGKKFYVEGSQRGSWIYRHDNRIYCSYKCFKD